MKISGDKSISLNAFGNTKCLRQYQLCIYSVDHCAPARISPSRGNTAAGRIRSWLELGSRRAVMRSLVVLPEKQPQSCAIHNAFEPHQRIQSGSASST
jgi:hypothetical protein